MKIHQMMFGFSMLLISHQLLAQPVVQIAPPAELDVLKAIEAIKVKTKEKATEIEAQKATKGTLKLDALSPLTLLQASVKGTFWRNPKWVMLLELSGEQQKKMDEAFHQYRLKLIDLTASLQKEELILEPLFAAMPAAPENEAKILTQIDRIADARAELEKANSRMLVGILQILTPEQRNKLPMPGKTKSEVFTFANPKQ
jgi:Spy/CpxP family protein refolding chaperone